MIIIDVPREESIRRLSSRGRADDQVANWNKKLDMYAKRMPKYEEMLAEQGVPVYHVDGVGEIEDVAERMLDVYKKFVQK